MKLDGRRQFWVTRQPSVYQADVMSKPPVWQALGAAQGILGLTGALAGVSAGFVADRCSRRDRTLRAFGVLSLSKDLRLASVSVRSYWATASSDHTTRSSHRQCKGSTYHLHQPHGTIHIVGEGGQIHTCPVFNRILTCGSVMPAKRVKVVCTMRPEQDALVSDKTVNAVQRAIICTSATLVLPRQYLPAIGHETDTRYALLLVSLALWGVSMGSGPVWSQTQTYISHLL